MNGIDGRRGSSGSATVLVLAATAAVLTLALGGIAVVTAGLVRQRAEAAADLAALAGAAALQREDDPCTRAATVASAQGATLQQCRLDSRDVVVQAQVPVGGWLRTWVGPGIRARARAGPAP